MKCLRPTSCTSAALAPSTAKGRDNWTLLCQAAGFKARFSAAKPRAPLQGVLMISTVGYETSR